MLDIAQCFRYPTTGPDRFVFTMDIKSLYTVIPNNDGLLALRHFLNKRPVQEPPSHTLVRLAELFLTLNSFSFNGDYFQQTGGVAMGSRLGPNYACLFVGHVEEQKSSNSIPERSLTSTNDILTTSQVQLPAAKKKMTTLLNLSTTFIQALNSLGPSVTINCLF